MGYYISHLEFEEVGDYIGSNTIWKLSYVGAFSGDLNDSRLLKLIEENEDILAVVEGKDIWNFLICASEVRSRDIEKMCELVREKYFRGFIVSG